jgi:cation diffusion facilitator family transporter
LTYGYGRVENLAGVAIVLIIVFSAVVACYEAVTRLFHPQPVGYLWAVMAAAVIGFVGNEAVAIFRITVGKEISSAALVADGYHARVDGWTSLAVLLGALGVWLGYPLADSVIGLLITVAIFWLVWQAGSAPAEA